MLKIRTYAIIHVHTQVFVVSKDAQKQQKKSHVKQNTLTIEKKHGIKKPTHNLEITYMVFETKHTASEKVLLSLWTKNKTKKRWNVWKQIKAVLETNLCLQLNYYLLSRSVY